MTAIEPLLAGLLGIVCVLAAVSKIRSARTSGALAAAVPTWPTVEGTVTAVARDTVIGRDANDNPTTTVVPVVEYAYNYAGTNYTGDGISFGEGRVGEDYTESVLAAYAPDEPTTVSVNPDDPTEAYLDATGNWEDEHRSGRTIGGLLLIVVGAGLLAYAYLSGPF